MSLLKSVLFFIFFISANTSYYEFKTVWKDQNGEKKVLKDFSGSPVLISMVYTACAHTCPMTISKVQEIKTDLEKAGFNNVRVVLASFDTKTDTPDHLKKYMSTRKLDEKAWTFLSPLTDKAVRELSVVLGISFKKLDDKDYSHSNVITLLDKNGNLLAKIDSLSSDIQVFKNALAQHKD